jgi:aspartate racemase
VADVVHPGHATDRTQTLLGAGPSPVPLLTQSVRRLYGSHQAKGADFAVIACNTAHAYLDEVRRRVRLPFLDMIGETVEAACARYGPQVTIGVLGTTGTVRADLYGRTAAALGHCVRTFSLLDVRDGARDGAWLQENLVMAPIYGPRQRNDRGGGGIKSGLVHEDPEQTRVVTERAAGPLRDAVHVLARHGAQVCVLASTEIPLALGRAPVDGMPLLDPIQVAAAEAMAVAAGDRPLPARGRTAQTARPSA